MYHLYFINVICILYLYIICISCTNRIYDISYHIVRIHSWCVFIHCTCYLSAWDVYDLFVISSIWGGGAAPSPPTPLQLFQRWEEGSKEGRKEARKRGRKEGRNEETKKREDKETKTRKHAGTKKPKLKRFQCCLMFVCSPCRRLPLPWHSPAMKLLASAQSTFIALHGPLIDILSVDKPRTDHGQLQRKT